VTRVEPGSPAAKAGIARGDVIQEVNRQPVSNVDEFKEASEKESGEEGVLLLVRRGEESLFLVVPTQ